MNENNNLAKTSKILGIIAISTSIILWNVSVPVSIAGLIIGIIAAVKNQNAKTGIILNSIALFISIIFVIVGTLLFFKVIEDGIKNFPTSWYGEEYSIINYSEYIC